jgi:polyphenol oxidase
MVPDWPAPAGVRAVFTARSGGASRAPWDSMNLGDHVGDAPARVQANRGQLAQWLGAKPVFLQQVHGTHVQLLDKRTADSIVADAAITTQDGLACTIMVADCLPVLLTDAQGTCVGALHAGWRGLAQGVVQICVQAMRQRTSGDLLAWLGPCIGPQAFEVGEDVRQAFAVSDWADLDSSFTVHTPGKYFADLPQLMRNALRKAGVTQIFGNDGSHAWCTVAQPSRFFSHRRDSAVHGGDIRSTGRMAACIWLV